MRPAATRRPAWSVLLVTAILVASVTPVGAAEYTGRIIDVHSHLPDARAIDQYVDAMKRHNIVKVVLLGAGGIRPHDAAWIRAAARRFPTRVIPGLPLPSPTAEHAADQLEASLVKRGARVIGEVHIRHVGRRIDRDPSDGPFVRVLDVAGTRGVPVVIHDDLDTRARSALETALAARPRAIVILAHAGGAGPSVIEPLLAGHPNLLVDLSGMQSSRRTPPFATESGRLDHAWKALIEAHPDRFLVGLDAFEAPRFDAAALDRLMSWTRRVLGDLRPAVARRVAYRNAAALFHVD